MKLGCLITSLVLVILITVGIVWGNYAKQNAPIPVTTARVERKDFTREATGTGNIEAKVYSLSFTEPARVARVLVQEQDTVRAGAVLAVLDRESDRQALDAARVNLAALNTALATQQRRNRNDRRSLEADLAQAQRRHALADKLWRVGAESEETVRDLRKTFDRLQADLNTLDATAAGEQSDVRAKMAQARAEIQRATRSLADAQLTAPVSGAIAQVDFRPGEAAQGVIKLVQAHSARLKAQMQEVDAGLLAPGMTARVELDADPDHPLTAVIDELGVMATVKSEGGSATLPVKFRFIDSAEHRARPGFTASVTVVTQRMSKVLQVPLESLIEEEKAGVRSYRVWTVTPPEKMPAKGKAIGTAQRRAVKVLARNLSHAVVEAIDAGTRIVTLPPDTLKDGKKVSFDVAPEKDTK